MGNCIDGPKKKSSITKGPFTVAKGVKLIWDQEEERWVKAPINIQISPATFATGSMRIVHRAWELTMDAKGMASEQDVLDEVRVATTEACRPPERIPGSEFVDGGKPGDRRNSWTWKRRKSQSEVAPASLHFRGASPYD